MGLKKGVATRSRGGRVAVGMRGAATGSSKYKSGKSTDIARSARSANTSNRNRAPGFSAWN